ncbi:hypothetical protein RN001_002518 [Aquatica leii]|uniref:Organic solute transporter alpha-like protein n=1 Tax=Aquatica leii TaxID=1421715 RepID=A0AAN7SK72_9COLE|nr:hypothetical protein RN001_002518 [Aquatica leii]
MDEDFVANEVVAEQLKRYGFSKFAKIRNYNNLSCPDIVPSTPEYLSAISWYGIALVTFGAFAVMVILYMFIDTLRYIMKNAPPRVKAHSAFVIGVYPIIGLATLCATIVPRSQLLAEAVTQGIFMVGMYQLFCLFVAYCGGEAELIRKVKPTSLNTKVAPCCCWPCCSCLPLLDINKNRLRYLRILVLQLPIVQGLVYMTLLVLWAERESLYQINYIYVQPVIVASIFIGIWSMSMTIQLLKDVLKDYNIFSKFIALQLVLMSSKLQALIIKGIVWLRVLPCHPPLTPTVYANLIYNCLILLEMVLLEYFARKLYKSSFVGTNSISDTQSVRTVKYSISATSTTSTETNNNTEFYYNKNIELHSNQLPMNSEPVNTRSRERF